MKSVHSSGRGSPVLFSPVLFLGQKCTRERTLQKTFTALPKNLWSAQSWILGKLGFEQEGARTPNGVDTEYDQAKVAPNNGNNTHPPLAVQRPFCFYSYKAKYTKQGNARCASEVRCRTSSIPSIVRHPCCPTILGMKGVENVSDDMEVPNLFWDRGVLLEVFLPLFFSTPQRAVASCENSQSLLSGTLRETETVPFTGAPPFL